MRRAYDALGFGVGNLVTPAPPGNVLRPRAPPPAQVPGAINPQGPQPPPNMSVGTQNVRLMPPQQSTYTNLSIQTVPFFVCFLSALYNLCVFYQVVQQEE